MDNLSRNLSQRLRDRGWTQAQLADEADVEPATINRVIKGSAKLVADSAHKIAKALGISVAELLSENPVSSEPQFLNTAKIPVLDKVKAGHYAGVNPTFRDAEMTEWVDSTLNTGKRGFAFVVDGDSMVPDFQPGDYALVDPDRGATPGCFVIATNAAGEATLKRYAQKGIDSEGREIFALVPSNSHYRTMYSDQEPIKVVAKVVGRVQPF